MTTEKTPAPGVVGRPALEGRGLTLSYDDRRITEDLDLQIPRGEITVILGPNACGKSTPASTVPAAHPAARRRPPGRRGDPEMPPKACTAAGVCPRRRRHRLGSPWISSRAADSRINGC